MSGYTEAIRNEILTLPCQQIFVAHELKKEKFPNYPETIYYKTLERMVKQEQLVHLAKGLYYRPMKDANDIVPISDEIIVDYYTADNTGALIGDGLFIEKGISSGFEKRITLLSNRLTENHKKIGNIEVRRSEIELNETTIPIIETLEILQNYPKISNINKREFIAYLHDFVDNYSDEQTEYVLSRCKYKKSTIAFLARILDWYGLAHSMHEHLSPLSEYKIPSIEELRLGIPEDIQQQLDQYVNHIKNIFGNQLYQIILYGSYAKGNFGHDSDVDIMILLNQTVESSLEQEESLAQLSFDYQIDHNIDISPVVKSKDIFNEWKDTHPFYNNISKEGVVLYDAA